MLQIVFVQYATKNFISYSLLLKKPPPAELVSILVLLKTVLVMHKQDLIKHHIQKVFLLILSFIGLCFFSDLIIAHERWILTPEQITHWNSLQRPLLFSEWSPLNLTMISIFAIFIIGWVWLGFTGARELFPDLQARLSSYGDHVPRILSFYVGWILLSSAFGAEPRFIVAVVHFLVSIDISSYHDPFEAV